MEGSSFFQRLKRGLTKSRESWTERIGTLFQNRRWDEESLDVMEDNLIAADVGPAVRKTWRRRSRHAYNKPWCKCFSPR